MRPLTTRTLIIAGVIYAAVVVILGITVDQRFYLALIALAFARGLAAWRAAAVAGVLIALCASLVVGPAVGAIQQGPVKEAAVLSRDLPVQTVIWDLDNPSIGVYRRAATPNRRPEPGEAVITRVTNLERLPDAEVVYAKGGIVLALLPAAPGPAD